jgi:hypothetical protein
VRLHAKRQLLSSDFNENWNMSAKLSEISRYFLPISTKIGICQQKLAKFVVTLVEFK